MGNIMTNYGKSITVEINHKNGVIERSIIIEKGENIIALNQDGKFVSFPINELKTIIKALKQAAEL